WREETFDAVSNESSSFEGSDETYDWIRYSGSLRAERHVKNTTDTKQTGVLPRRETTASHSEHKTVVNAERETYISNNSPVSTGFSTDLKKSHKEFSGSSDTSSPELTPRN
ncbi:MAG: hypothetical protein JW809_06635, partial [Pirellulales bacterium]|nr:hypothetical protein [Pirellulales bacterium]